MKNAVAALIVLAALAPACSAPSLPSATLAPQVRTEMPGPPPQTTNARVSRVVDGDTVVLQGIDVGSIDRATAGRRARLIGIDTPEVFGQVGCFGREASAFTKQTLLGRSVRIAFDIDRTDRFGRALVYIWLPDGSFFNATLAAEGYALQETVPPNVRYADLFARLVTQARDANLGLWRGCPVG